MMKNCLTCSYFEKLDSDDSAEPNMGLCCVSFEEKSPVYNVKKKENCPYWNSLEEIQRRERERKENIARKKENAAEIVQIMETWRDRVNPIVLEFAINAIKMQWGLK